MRTPYSRIEPQEYEGDHESPKALLTEKFERCSFCNSKLIFTHDLNLSYLQVVETGRCSGCGVTLNPKKYTLQ